MSDTVATLAAGDPGKAAGILDGVLAELRSAVKVKPESAEAHFPLGSMLGKTGERSGDSGMVEEGLLECRIAAQLEPAWDMPRVKAGIILINTKRYEEALKELESAAQSFDDISTEWCVVNTAMAMALLLELDSQSNQFANRRYYQCPNCGSLSLSVTKDREVDYDGPGPEFENWECNDCDWEHFIYLG